MQDKQTRDFLSCNRQTPSHPLLATCLQLRCHLVCLVEQATLTGSLLMALRFCGVYAMKSAPSFASYSEPRLHRYYVLIYGTTVGRLWKSFGSASWR
ncbi:hypothetical protein PAXRUDRAFT_831562 [Paxillus rubicundulus Ve08.2h10]|uniref:Uncharacterized protein n=1 Tax=Paxillus rubicundulus Ve08.2h10 TaxID=930991 RepID=A0A0D0D256_9AGAM|nr:hypothetical protein PAXRUDRAFT_831562 [Paxillus rubicundulus Ve08.2h10]